MPLIIHPLPNADSFISVPDAKIVIDKYTLDGAKWDAKTPSEQEVLLRIAYNDILDHTDPTTYPNPLPVCVGEAQALMAVHDVVNSISGGGTASTQQVKKQKAGPIEREFFEAKTAIKSTSRIPDQAQKCLAALGYSFPKFGQIRLGRS